MTDLDYDMSCRVCHKPIGDHTLRGYRDELSAAGFDYEFPATDLSGAMKLPGLDGPAAGELKLYALAMDTPVGKIPGLRFVFTGPGDAPMERREFQPVNLIMDARGLRSVAELVVAMTNRAITASQL